MNKLEIVKTNPVARFYYKGASHSHPVRRTVVLTETNADYFRGYEVRNGFNTRYLEKAPVKTYSRNKIARNADLDARRRPKTGLNASTLQREDIWSLVTKGA